MATFSKVGLRSNGETLKDAIIKKQLKSSLERLGIYDEACQADLMKYGKDVDGPVEYAILKVNRNV